MLDVQIAQQALIIAAHPDDEVLGAGGFMAHVPGTQVALVSEGTSEEPGLLQNGGTLTYEEMLEAKRQATKRAAQRLNAAVVREGDFRDQHLHAAGPALHHWIESVIMEVRPSLVLTHSAAELNRDHQAVAQAVAVACRPYCASGGSVAGLLTFHVDPLSAPGLDERPALVLGLTEAEVAAKLEALEYYDQAGALRTWPHPRSLRALELQMRALGTRWGLTAGEGYSLVWGTIR